MNCQQINQMLLQTQKDEIPTQTRRDIEKHLVECANCRNNVYLTEMEDEVLNEPVEVPLIRPDFIQRTMQLLPQDLYVASQIHSTPASPAKKERKLHHAWLGAVASLLLLFGVSFYFYQDLSFFASKEPTSDQSHAMVVAEQNYAPLSKITTNDHITSQELVDDSFDSMLESSPEEESMTESQESAATDTNLGSIAMKPASYDMNSTSSPSIVLASSEADVSSNPYQYAPASSYTSSIESYHQTSRSGGSEMIEATQTSELPDIVLSNLPEQFRLVDFSCQESTYTFYYQDDISKQHLHFTVIPYDSSTSLMDIPGDSILYQLVACGDITYQVALNGTLPEGDLEQILDDLSIQQQ